MKNGICPNCNSTHVYKSANNSWAGDGLTIRFMGTKVNEVFQTEAYLCLDCRHLQVFVEETAAAIFGKGKTLPEVVPVSSNWQKVSS